MTAAASDAGPAPPVARQVTVSLIPEADAALAALAGRTRLSGTDLVNRALLLYDFADSEAAAGAEVLVRSPDGTVRRVTFL